MADKEEIKKAGREKKEQEIQQALGVEISNLGTLDDEKIDELYGMAALNMNESIDNIIECMETINAPKNDLVEAVAVHSGFKMDEAKEIIDNKLLEKNRSKSKADGLFEYLGI